MESIPNKKIPLKYKNLANLTLIIVIIVILWGAFVRVTHSGAGCGEHWPLCDGQIIITDVHYEKLIEYTHRFTSGFSFILVALLFFLSRRVKDYSLFKTAAFWSFFFITTEALIGAGLVLFGWVKDNSSVARALVIALHLINSFALLYNLTLCSLTSSFPNLNISKANFRKSAKNHLLLITLFLIVGAFGAVTALGDTLFPSNSLVEGFWEDLSITSHFLIRLRIFHPILALILSVKLISLFINFEFKNDVSKYSSLLRNIPKLGIVLVIAQVILGVTNVLLLAPNYIQISHLLLSIVLWMTFISIIFIEADTPN